MPCVHLLVPQGEHLLHGRDPGASKAFAVLVHLDGLQPLGHRSEHGAVTAAGTGQADGNSVRDKSAFGLVSIDCDIIASVCQFHLLNTDQGFKRSSKRNSIELSCRSRK